MVRLRKDVGKAATGGLDQNVTVVPMLLNETCLFAPQLALFTTPEYPSNECPTEMMPLPAEMLDLFEQITGWVIEFKESGTSYKRRQLPTFSPQTATGSFSIIDMSNDWPACKPTGHRAKCDQFVALVDGLVHELLETKSALLDAQSQLAAYSPTAAKELDAPLVDSFIPRYSSEFCQDSGCGPACDCGPASGCGPNAADDFELAPQSYSGSSIRAVDPPFEGWHFGGAPGIIDGRYIDWEMDEEEQIKLYVGQIESLADGQASVEEGDAILSVDPLTHEYHLSGDPRFKFWLYDRQHNELSVIQPSSDFRQLAIHQSVIMTTCADFRCAIHGDQNSLESSPSPEQIATRLNELLEAGEQVLVLNHN